MILMMTIAETGLFIRELSNIHIIKLFSFIMVMKFRLLYHLTVRIVLEFISG